MFEGDIVLRSRENEHDYASFKGRRWPNAIVQYEIKSSIGKLFNYYL